MSTAVRISDPTNEGGMVVGTGAPTVLIEGKPAAVVGDSATSKLPNKPPVSDFVTGSATVFMEGKPSIRTGDSTISGAEAIAGQSTVIISG